MKYALSLEFIHRRIYNAWPQNEWLPIACIARVCTACAFLRKKQCVWRVFIPRVICQGDRTSADWWKNVCFNEPPEWIHLERDLALHFTLLLLLSEVIWSISHQSTACVCVLLMFVYLCVFCVCIFVWVFFWCACSFLFSLFLVRLCLSCRATAINSMWTIIPQQRWDISSCTAGMKWLHYMSPK